MNIAVTPTSWSCFFGTGWSCEQTRQALKQKHSTAIFFFFNPEELVNHSAEVTYLKKAVNDCKSHVHGLLQQPKLDLDLDEPVNKDGAHVPSDLSSFQIPWSDSLISLGDKCNKGSKSSQILHRYLEGVYKKNVFKSSSQPQVAGGICRCPSHIHCRAWDCHSHQHQHLWYWEARQRKPGTAHLGHSRMFPWAQERTAQKISSIKNT